MNNQYSYWSEGNVCKFQGGNHEGAVQERGGVCVRTIDSWECHSSHGSDVHIVPLCVCQAMGTGMSGAPVLAFFSAASTEKSGGTDLPKAPWVPLLGRKPAQLCFHYLTLLRNLHKCICLFTSDASSAQFRRGKNERKWEKYVYRARQVKPLRTGERICQKSAGEWKLQTSINVCIVFWERKLHQGRAKAKGSTARQRRENNTQSGGKIL